MRPYRQVTVKHEKNFTTVSNGFIRDKRLSLKGKGLLLTVLSLNSEEWDFSINGICSILKESRTAVYNTIDELIELGYCTREQYRDEGTGRLMPMFYTFYEVSENQPRSENMNADYVHTDSDTQLNTNRKEVPKEEVTSTTVDVPSENASAGKKKNLSVIKEKKEKKYSATHRCRLAFEHQYLQFKGEEYYYAAKDANAVKQLIDKIKTKMPDEDKNNDDAIAFNFDAFIQAILNSGRVEKWIIDNFSLPVINSKFNEIYSQLKNGRQQHQNARDDEQSFLDELERRYGNGPAQ